MANMSNGPTLNNHHQFKKQPLDDGTSLTRTNSRSKRTSKSSNNFVQRNLTSIQSTNNPISVAPLAFVEEMPNLIKNSKINQYTTITSSGTHHQPNQLVVTTSSNKPFVSMTTFNPLNKPQLSISSTSSEEMITEDNSESNNNHVNKTQRPIIGFPNAKHTSVFLNNSRKNISSELINENSNASISLIDPSNSNGMSSK